MIRACDFLAGLSVADLWAMEQLNRKFNGLRRLAYLLESSLDPTSLVPDITRLVPLNQIDLSTYQYMRLACPFLNLPDAQAGLDALKAQLADAYQDLINMLLEHPWWQMNDLQRMLDRFQNELSFDMGRVSGYLKCAAAVCGAAVNLPADLERHQVIVDDFQRNFVNNTNGVLTEGMVRKRDQVGSLVNGLQSLMVDNG
jgi:hypothetical protein